MCEHLGVSHKTGESLKYNVKTTTAIRDHIKDSGHINDFTSFEILNFGKNNLESVWIKKINPPLNKQVDYF